MSAGGQGDATREWMVDGAGDATGEPIPAARGGSGIVSRHWSNCAAAGAKILSVTQVKPSLEEYFMHLVEADRAQAAASR